MFKAPPEDTLEWSGDGVEGSARFVRRLWRMAWEHLEKGRPAQGPIQGLVALSPAQREMRRLAHATLAKVTDDAPVVLLAHEPDIFTRVPERVSLTLSGHTHGGQVRMFGYSPMVPSRFGNRFAYGHIVEGNRNLIVSGGLGCSILPVRIGVPPEIVIVHVSARSLTS